MNELLEELATTRKKLEFLTQKVDALTYLSGCELNYDKVVFEDEYDVRPVCDRGEIEAWAQKTLEELEAIE